MPNLVEIGSVVPEKKLKCSKVYEQRKTDDERRCTKTKSNRSPEVTLKKDSEGEFRTERPLNSKIERR